MKKNILVIITLFFCFGFSAFSQELTITGIITSTQDDAPVPLVNVYVKGTTTGVTSDFDGKYVLKKVQKTDSIVFSFVGFKTQKVYVGNRTVIDVKLSPTEVALSEVVVTALGVKRQAKELGYSTQKVEGTELLKADASNVLSALSGKSAGVQIGNSDGVDGGTTRITIRGNNSIGGKNQPLIVVDGVPMENDPGMLDTKTGTDWGSSINNINSYDIAEMNILKGGAASALYGSRGANGVILITTKKGSTNKGIGVGYNFGFKLITPYRFREVQNKYGGGGPTTFSVPQLKIGPDGLAEFPNLGHTDYLVIDQDSNMVGTTEEFGYYGTAASWGAEMLDQPMRWWDGSVRNWSPQPDNLKKIFKNGSVMTHNLSFEGGGNLGSFRLSLTRVDNKPIVENSKFNQTTIALNTVTNVSKRIQIGVNANYMDYSRLNSPTLGEAGSSFNKGLIYSWPRSYQLEDFDKYASEYGDRLVFEDYPYDYIDDYIWWNYYNNNTVYDKNKLIGGITLTYNITDWLSFMGRTGLDFQLEQFETKNKPVDLGGIMGGYYANSLKRDRSNNSEFMFTLQKDSIFHSNINIKCNIGAASWSRKVYGISGNSGSWYYPYMYAFVNFTEPDTANDVVGDKLSTVSAKESVWRKKINSIYSFINISYKNYLFLDITGRNDWSSALPNDNNSYFYPSATLSFILSDAFKFNDSWLNFFKIRGGISQTATDTEPFSIIFNYSSAMFGLDQSVIYPNLIPPYTLKPQRVNSYEAGTNIEMLKGKISLDFTYYYVYSFDQIMRLPLPASSGATNIVTNEGVLTNKGIEVVLSTTPVSTKNMSVKTGINFSRNRNRVKDLGGESDVYELTYFWGLYGPTMSLREGDDFGTMYGYDYVYIDGKPVVNAEGTKYKITDTRVPVGNASPKFTGGWYAQLRYKRISLHTQIDVKWGGDIYCGSYVSGLQTGQAPETLLERDGGGLPYTDPDGVTRDVGVILPGVHEDGTPNTTVVHYLYKYLPNAGGWGKIISTPGIVENSWVKFRELALTYTLPPKWINKLKVFQDCSISFVGRDLFYIYTSLPYKINPEGIIGASDAQGFEWGAMPGIRSFSFQLNAKF